jgi:membrane fusion protein, multidrug efflux system
MNANQRQEDALRLNAPSGGDGAATAPQTGIVAGRSEEKDGAHPPPVTPAPMSPRKKAIYGGLGVVGLAAACYFGIPWLLLVFATVSTDDAYVNGHVTLVAPRVSGQVVKVLVDDNYRVKKGDLLVVLDKVPYQVQVDIKQSALATAKAELGVATAQVHGQVAQARSNRFKLENAIQDVNRQIFLLKGNVDALDKALPIRKNALDEFNRYTELMKTKGATTQQELDLRLQNYLVAKAQVRQALQGVYQIRAGLGLETKLVNGDDITEAPKNLGEVPDKLDQTFSGVRQALADMLQSAAVLGVYPKSYDALPREVLKEFLHLDPEGKENLDRIFAKIMESAPTLQQAKTKVEQAQSDLDQALLNYSYCDVRSEIDGVVTRRNVNPGNNLQAGQSVMAVRSLTEIWIDANFKETQLRDLRIGQPVKIEVDMYGGRHEFKGRITGFTMGTGQTLALLPPQNATGNFVKIVQRLPVKVELIDYDPDRLPLFVGLSVMPYVYIREPLVENDPGKGNFLQPLTALPQVPRNPNLWDKGKR